MVLVSCSTCGKRLGEGEAMESHRGWLCPDCYREATRGFIGQQRSRMGFGMGGLWASGILSVILTISYFFCPGIDHLMDVGWSWSLFAAYGLGAMMEQRGEKRRIALALAVFLASLAWFLYAAGWILMYQERGLPTWPFPLIMAVGTMPFTLIIIHDLIRVYEQVQKRAA